MLKPCKGIMWSRVKVKLNGTWDFFELGNILRQNDPLQNLENNLKMGTFERKNQSLFVRSMCYLPFLRQKSINSSVSGSSWDGNNALFLKLVNFWKLGTFLKCDEPPLFF